MGETELEPGDAALIARLIPPTPTAYHRLNPLTKVTVATAGSIGAFLLGGYVGPLAIAGAMLLLAQRADVARRLLRDALTLTLPLAVSVVLVSVFTRAGTTVLVEIGPFDATLEGVDFAGQTLVRLLAISLSIGLFVLTTDPRALVGDLERRGISARAAYIASATLEAIPTLIRRAASVAESQRARGLDTEGGVLGRPRGIVPMIGPVILGALIDVEERSLALESRAFTRPGRRHLLWAMPDSGWERGFRWLLVASIAVLAVARLLGRL